MTLMDDLNTATSKARICPLCRLIERSDEPLRSSLRDAAAGTLGIAPFVRIMQKHETGVGRRTVEVHREEGHQP